MYRALPALALALCFAACAPPPAPSTAGPAGSMYVVRVSTGDREGISVDWAILPDEGWPVDGRRDRTPFTTELPTGRVAAIFRARPGAPPLEVTLLKRLPDGTLERHAVASDLTLGVVVIDPRSGRAEILASSAASAPK